MADINAYLKKRRRRRGLYWEVVLVALAVVAVIAASWWLIFRSRVFRVEAVEIKKSDSFSEEEIRSYLEGKINSSWWSRQLGTHNFLAWPGEIPASELNDFTKAKSIIIDKSYFGHKLSVEVVERDRLGVWCAMKEAKCFWFDDDGYMFNEAPDIQGNLITIVSDTTQTGLGLGKKILPDRYIKNFFSIVEVLKKSQASGKIEIEDLSLEEVRVVNEGGPKLYFSLRFPADNTSAVIDSLKGSGEYQKIQYIDFRIPNRAYYK